MKFPHVAPLAFPASWRLSLLLACSALAACSSSSDPSNGFVGTGGNAPIVEMDACTALLDCCTADDACPLYCSNYPTDCDRLFHYELVLGYCSGYTYKGFVADSGLPMPDASTCPPDAGS